MHMNKQQRQIQERRKLCSGCGKVHYMPPNNRSNARLTLTAKGWWATDPQRRELQVL